MNTNSYEHLAKQYIPGIDLAGCSHIDVGVHGHVLITKDRRVVKIPTVPRDASLYGNEQNTLEYFQHHISVHVARILEVIEAPEAPAGYILEMEHALGNELRPADLESYSHQELQQLGKKIGTFLAELHTMPLSPDLNTKHILTPDIPQELSQLSQNPYWGALDDFEHEHLVNIYERAIPYFRNEITETPLHNDFGMNHVFVEKHTLSAVIDWDCQKVGDPARDWRWAIGPRSIHPVCFTEALSAYMERFKTDPTFLGRVLYYNEVKAANTLARADSPERLALARKSLEEYRESIQFLYEFIEKTQQ